jgi:riboflavin kinase / FMN adenylyltransferase
MQFQSSVSVDEKTVLTLGAFDGMHLGHQRVLAQVKQCAAQKNARSVVVLFEPKPKEYFAQKFGQTAAPRLMRLRDQVNFLKAFGIDDVVCLRFTEQLANMTAEDFVQDVLVKGLNACHIVIGDDFKFGKNRAGDFTLLQTLGKQYGFTLEDTPTLEDSGGRVSSSHVREAVMAGDFTLAKSRLGHDYALAGRVGHGLKLGRELGFPTLNVMLRQAMAVHGVYAVTVRFEGSNQTYQGMANVGTRPAVQGEICLLEVNVFDFNQDVYGQRVEVTFHHKVRDELDFESLEALTEKIAEDEVIIRQWFATQHQYET